MTNGGASSTDASHYKRTWSVSAAANIFWVVLAYVFTVVLSLANLTSDVGSNGQSVGTVWLWLVPIVAGWQQLSPKNDHSYLEDIFDSVNDLAYVTWPNALAVRASTIGHLHAISIDALVSKTLFFLDENRGPPIFNYARFFAWSESAEMICNAFDHASSGPINPPSPDDMDDYCGIRATSRRKWASGVCTRMIVASFIALALQWGTSGASIIGEILSPTVGLGCRSLGYAIYGSISTLVWMLLVVSSILAHYASPFSPFIDPLPPLTSLYRPPLSHRVAASVADGLCSLGKILAILNTCGIIAIGILQFSNSFVRCYCSASVLSRGRSAAFVTVYVDSNFVETGWIGGLVLALSTCIGFILFINLMR